MKGKILALFVLLFCALGNVKAQEKVEPFYGGEIVSKYVWRGQDFGGVAVQPYAGLSYKGFSFTVWSSLGFTNEDVAEVDLIVEYTTGGFTASITDCWSSYYGSGDKYFAYGANSTCHTFEALVGYDFGPVNVAWSTNFAGYDGVTPKGKRAYASYCYVAAPFSLLTIDWEGGVGFTPWASDYYAGYASTAGCDSDDCYAGTTGFAVCEIALQAVREFKISDSFSFSLMAKGCYNPAINKFYFVAGISL